MDNIYIFYFVLVHFDSVLFLFLNYGQTDENSLTRFEIFFHELYLDMVLDLRNVCSDCRKLIFVSYWWNCTNFGDIDQRVVVLFLED